MKYPDVTNLLILVGTYKVHIMKFPTIAVISVQAAQIKLGDANGEGREHRRTPIKSITAESSKKPKIKPSSETIVVSDFVAVKLRNPTAQRAVTKPSIVEAPTIEATGASAMLNVPIA